MSKISENFWRYEMACKCGCGYDTCDVELSHLLELIRRKIGKYSPSNVCRCLEHNEVVQKSVNNNYVPYSSKSMHLYGRAGDIDDEALHLYGIEKLYKELCEQFPNEYGFGIYNWGIHVDTKTGGARRWDRR